MTQSTFSAQVANKLLTILQGYSKTIRLLLIMFLTLTVTTNAWAETITKEISSFSTTSGTIGDVTYTAYKGGGTSNPAVNSGAIRLYQNASGNTAGYIVLSVPDGYKITSATIKSTMKTTTGYYIASNPGATTPSKNSFEVSNYSLAANTPYTVSGLSTQHITFACFGTTSSTRLYLSYLAVTYETPGGGSTTVDPEVTFSNGEYTIGGAALDLSTLWDSNSTGAVTYSVTNAGTTGATVNGTSFTATAAGTCTVQASQAATASYNAITKTATITVSAPAGGDGDDDADTWTLVKNVNDLATGDQVVIAASSDNYALSTTQNSNNRGRAAVTKNGETITFGNDVQVLTLQTGNVNGTLAFYTGNGYLHAASSSSNYLRTETTLSNNSSWTITITNTGIATIKAQGTYTKNWLRYNSSSSIFSCYSSGQGDVSIYKKGGSGGGGSTPDPDPIPVTSVSLDITSHTMNEGETVTLTATVTPDNADDKTFTWKSSDENIAKVNTNGIVTAVSKGNATITVTTKDGGHTATCTITVNALPTVEGTWTLVTNAANLKAGDRIVIAAADYDFALSTTQNTNNRGQASVTKNGNTITFTEATQIITLEAGTVDNTLAFNTGAGYLYAASSNSNHLKTQPTNNNNGSWSISIDGSTGVATVVAQGENTNNTLFYNQSSKLFSCYANTATQKAIAIYKEGGGTTTYTITSTLSHVTANGGNPTTITSEAEDLTLSYSAESGWNLPATISVTMGGTPLSSETDYYWDNGDLLIAPASGFTGNIVVTINGWQQLAAPTGLNVANITSSGATLSWSPVANASSYMVFITDLDDEEITLTDIEKTSVDVTNLSSETFYLWDVVAIGDGINYTDSEHSSQEDPNAEFTTRAAATPTADYTIIHHRQALDGNYIADSLVVKTTGTADVGSTITAEQKTYTGFVCNDVVQTITIQEDAAQNVVTYKYVRQSYTLTWDLDGGTIVTAGTPAGTVKYGAPLTAPTVEKAGYRFDHWNPNVPATMQDGNRTYKAFYTQQHTVKWVSQGTVIRTDIYDTGAALEAAPTTGIVECDGKKHVGWTAQGGYAHSTAAPADLFTESSGTVTADATYYAVYAEGSGGGGTGWTVVTSTSDLEAGATYAISNESTGGTYLSTWDGGNNFDGSTITICHLILGGSEGAWTFQISDESTHNNKYLTATSAVSNRLKAVNPVDEWSYFTISFDGNAAVITCTGKNTNNILRYNANNGSPIFACYSSGQSDVYLQKQTGGGGYTNYTTSCASITSIRIEEQTTTFDQYDAFNFGGTVYAIDEEYNETDVTELATFTGYDMSQAGTQTVTVSYSGCSVTYEITVNKLPVWNITWSVGGKTNTGIGPREVVQGKTIGECSSTGNLQIPEVPAGCEGKLFMGWSASSTVNSDGSDFTPITSATVPETNVTYYAVFAEPTGNGGAQGELFSESFETIEGSGGNDDKWDGNIASAQLTEHGDWEFTYAYKGYECIKLGKANGQGQATTPALGINGSATLTFAAGAWNGNNELLTINLQIVGEGSITPSSVTTLTKGQFTTYTANITDANADTKVQFIAANAANNRFFLDEVKVSGGSSDSYTDYSTSCGTYTVTFYGFNSGGYTTTCNYNPAEIAVAQGETYQIPNCEPTFDPAGLGRTFAGTWNTQANGKGTAYEPGDEFIVNSDITLYAQWALNTSEENTTLPTDVEDLATTDVVVTGGTTLTLQAGTTTINSLTLKGGIQADGSYKMPIINIPDNATLKRKSDIIYLDLVVNAKNYYPFAVPFRAKNGSDKANWDYVGYIDPVLKEAATYRTHFVIKTYDGAKRAENGENRDANWVIVNRDTYLEPGVGYIISALTYPDKETATIRIPMTVPNEWLANGEQESITVKEQTTSRNQVTVIAHTGPATDINNGGHQRHAGWNFVANPYLSMFAGGNVANDVEYIKGSINIQDKYTYEDTEVTYVTVPAYDFSYYEQFKLSETKLTPEYSFFVQVGTDGTMTFETTGRQQAPASIAARNAEERPVKMDVDITLSDNHSSDLTGIIISDRYNDTYEIGRDLEKLFGSAYNLSVYTLMADNTPLAYQALAIRSSMQVIPVGYRAPAQGEYTFRLNEATSSIDLLNEQYEQLVLVDYQTGALTNLLNSDYTFYSERTQSDNRFAIYAVPRQNASTDLPNAIGQDKEAQKIIHNGHLYILRNGNVYNGAGQIVK